MCVCVCIYASMYLCVYVLCIYTVYIKWWPKLLEHLAYLRGFSCFCWIGHYNTHKTNYCQNYLRQKKSAGQWKWWTGPLKVLDLNPWANLGELKKKNRSIVHSKKSLWLELQKAWDNISVEVLRKYIDTMPEICAAVIAAKGGYTKS